MNARRNGSREAAARTLGTATTAELRLAVEDGDHQRLIDGLAANAEPNCGRGAQAQHGPLHVAARLGDTKAAEVLLHAGADAERGGLQGQTALDAAVASGSPGCTRLLVRHAMPTGTTYSHAERSPAGTRCVAICLQRHDPTEAAGGLVEAIRARDAATVETMLYHGVPAGREALWEAAVSTRTILRRVLRCGAPGGSGTASCRKLLAHAAVAAIEDTMPLLIETLRPTRSELLAALEAGGDGGNTDAIAALRWALRKTLPEGESSVASEREHEPARQEAV